MKGWDIHFIHTIPTILKLLKILMVLMLLYLVSSEGSSFSPRVKKENTKRKNMLSKMASVRYFQGFLGKTI